MDKKSAVVNDNESESCKSQTESMKELSQCNLSKAKIRKEQNPTDLHRFSVCESNGTY